MSKFPQRLVIAFTGVQNFKGSNCPAWFAKMDRWSQIFMISSSVSFFSYLPTAVAFQGNISKTLKTF